VLLQLFRSEVLHRQLTLPAIRRVDHEPATFTVQRDALVTDLTDEVHRLARRLVERQPQLVLRELPFERLAQRRLSVKEAIRRHQTVDALVRAKVVVVAQPVTEPATRVFEVLRRSAIPKLVGDRLPKALALAERFGVVRAAHDVRNALLREQLLKAALATPSEVLATLVGQDFTRLAEARDAFEQGLGHERRALVRGQGPRHDIATVVVQKHRQVHAPTLAPQDVARDVGLPQLARSRALEATRRFRLRPWTAFGRRLQCNALFAQYVADRAGRDLDAVKALELVGDARHAEGVVLQADLRDQVAHCIRDALGVMWTTTFGRPARFESLGTFGFVAPDPLIEARRRAAPQAREVFALAAGLGKGFDCGATLIGCEALGLRRRARTLRTSLVRPVAEGRVLQGVLLAEG